MALIVQDATGKPDADTYVSLADFTTWAEKRNRDISTFSDEAIEAKLREATQYADTISRFKGSREFQVQSTEFPRAGLVDWSSFTITGIPLRLKDAICELAWASLSSGEDLYVDLDRGGQVQAESIGPISVSYAFNAPVGKTFRAAMQLLAQYLRDPKQSYAPFIGGTAGEATVTPLFDIDMHANRSE